MTPWLTIVGWSLIHFGWQACAIALPAAVTLKLCARGSANLRYLVACAGLAAMLLAPLLTVRVLSNAWWDARAAITAEATPAPDSRFPKPEFPIPDSQFPIPDSGFPRATNPQFLVPNFQFLIPPSALSLLNGVAPSVSVIWLIGVACLLGRMAGGWWQVRRLHRSAFAIGESEWQAACGRLARRLGLSAAARVVESAMVDVPAVVGWLRPVILLPVSALASLSPDQIEAILAHELAHVRRHDFVVNLLQTIAETLLFYHPAVWWLSSRIRAEREHCCDDVAIEVCGDPVVYAEALTTLEEWRSTSAAMAVAATGGPLLGRVRRILRVFPDDQPRSMSWVATLALTAFFVAGAGVFHAAVPLGPSELQAPAPLAPPAPSASAAQPPPPAPLPPGSASPAGGVSSALEGSWHMSRSHRGTGIDVWLSGDIRFNDDLTDVQSLSNGGRLTIREWTLFVPRTIEIRSDGGTLARTYYVAGLPRPWDADVQRKLRDLLPALVRRSGLGAESRVRTIFGRKGTPGVLDEIALLESDYARRLYFIALVDVAHLDAAGAAPVLTQVGERVRSNYERASILRRVAERVTLDEGAASAYVQAVAAMDSDYEKRRALSALLAVRPLPRDAANLVLHAAAGMQSDYERSQVLRAALQVTPAPEAARPGGTPKPGELAPEPANDALFEAVGSMQSAYEKRRVLVELLSRQPLTDDTKKAALMAAATIDSDYERGQVLAAYVRRFGVEAPLRRPFFAAVNTMQSDYEKRRLLMAVAAHGGPAGPGGIDGIDATIQRAVFDAVALMRSDYERAEVLLAFVRAGAVDSSSRQAFMTAAERMRSTHEQDRVLGALVRSER